MGQYEVYQWLKNRYEVNPNEWFTPAEVTQGLRDAGATNGALEHIRADLIRLCVCNVVEYQDLDKYGISNYKKIFRYKPKDKTIWTPDQQVIQT